MGKWNHKAGVACLLAMYALIAGFAAHAGDGSTPTVVQHQARTLGTRGFSERELDAFAAAYIKVAEIYNSHAAQIKRARNAEEAYQAQIAIEDKMSRAIREEGMSPDEYNQVVRTINENPQLGQKVAQKIRTLQ
ncbi:MAG: DUF4168 domain-containing protein [Gammaproteobacteria bacterium]